MITSALVKMLMYIISKIQACREPVTKMKVTLSPTPIANLLLSRFMILQVILQVHGLQA